MKRMSLLAAGALCVGLVSGASAQPYPTDGYIGVFSDAAGTQCCATIPGFTSGTLYVIAKLNGATANGITGAEFRLVFPGGTAGYFLTWNALADVPLGTPLPPANPDDPYGVNLAYSACKPDPPGSATQVTLGTIAVFNAGGPATAIQVLKKKPPGNPDFTCPLLVLCDGPVFTKICNTILETQTPNNVEAIGFVGGLNNCPQPGCGPVAVAEATWTGMKALYR